MYRLIISLVLVLSVSGRPVDAAITGVMDFDGLVPDGQTDVGYASPFVDSELGFQISVIGTDEVNDFIAVRPNAGSPESYLYRNSQGLMALTSTDSGDFAFESIDLGKLNEIAVGEFSVSFSGYLDGGLTGVETKSFTSPDFQTFTFGSAFDIVDRVEWSQVFSNGHRFDNISVQVTAVPEPTSLAFLGVGLGVAGVRRVRRRRIENAVA